MTGWGPTPRLGRDRIVASTSAVPCDSGPGAEAASARFDPLGCFDPARAELPVLWVPVDRVVDLLAVPHAPERIAAYRTAMLAGERFPPIAVLPFAGRYWVADGHKRWSAFRQLGACEVPVEIWTGRRWVRDQARQVAGTGRRLGRACALLASRPREGFALLAAAPLHWWRVARSLAGHAAAAAGGTRRRRNEARPEGSGSG